MPDGYQKKPVRGDIPSDAMMGGPLPVDLVSHVVGLASETKNRMYPNKKQIPMWIVFTQFRDRVHVAFIDPATNWGTMYIVDPVSGTVDLPGLPPIPDDGTN